MDDGIVESAADFFGQHTLITRYVYGTEEEGRRVYLVSDDKCLVTYLPGTQQPRKGRSRWHVQDRERTLRMIKQEIPNLVSHGVVVNDRIKFQFDEEYTHE